MNAVYSGSFDPVTLGHMDIITRAANLSERLTVAVLNNGNKNMLFSLDERFEQMKSLAGHIQNVTVVRFSGSLIELFGELSADAVVRGLRTPADFDHEFLYANALKSINPKIETLFFAADPALMHISSTMVKDAARFGCDIKKMVPNYIIDAVKKKVQNKDWGNV
ncbi:phosphopantetheine adenylyltransferase [Clostridia bacterium]|nr:phosphopantetheine adenylyltransferase [Clostridia bacterium]